MRLIKYLTENTDPFSQIWKNCQPYLDEIGVSSLGELEGGDYPLLYRGLDNNPTIKKLKTIKRVPKGTGLEFFDAINKWLTTHKFASRNNAAFVTGNEEWAGSFGDVNLFFPIGSYKYTWIPTKDWNDGPMKEFDRPAIVWLVKDNIQKPMGLIYIDGEDDFAGTEDQVKRIKTMDKNEKVGVVSFYNFNPFDPIIFWDTIENWNKRADNVKKLLHTNNLIKAINSNYEIWFNCDSYYLLNPDLIQWD